MRPLGFETAEDSVAAKNNIRCKFDATGELISMTENEVKEIWAEHAPVLAEKLQLLEACEIK